VLAVTGTNGKTTVTALTGQLVERAGKAVALAGNIGPTLLDTLARLDARGLPEVWVVELSSFQLATAAARGQLRTHRRHGAQPHPGPPGLARRHGRLRRRPRRGLRQQALMVLNRDDPLVMAMLPAPVRLKGPAEQRAQHRFGAGMPQRPGDFGIEVVNGMAWLVRALEARPETLKKRKGQADRELHIQRLMPAEALRIRGRHNAVNALAALALALRRLQRWRRCCTACANTAASPTASSRSGIVDEVEYFDDSKGTNVGATVAALHGLGAERKLVVILGGDGKGQDFSPLAAPVARYARAVVLIGRDAPLIRAALEGTGVELLDAATCRRRCTGHAAGPCPATPCCCRRPAPASTCSTTTPTAPACSAKRCRPGADAGMDLEGAMNAA
jgi:UDP-N-acetylmuramoylalanine--D-glutamate ligase